MKVKQSTEFKKMTPDARLDFVSSKANASAKLEDQGRKEVGKALAIMEIDGDTGSSDLKSYMKEKGVDLDSMKNVYEFARVARAVLKGEIAMTEEEFDKANKSKIEILSRFFKDENRDKLEEAVEMVKDDKSAKDIRGLLPKKGKNGGDGDGEGNEPKLQAALVVTDIDPNAPILTSATVKSRIRKDIETSLDSEPEALEDQLGILARMLYAAAVAGDKDPHTYLQDAAAAFAARTGGTVVETETEKLAA